MDKLFQPQKGEYRDCRKCGYETREDISRCPKCATELQSESKIRNAGSADVGLGWILAIMMGGIFFGLLCLYIYGKNFANATTRANFSKFEADFVFLGAFAFVLGLLGFAVTMIRAGRFAIKTGRRDRARIKKALAFLIGALIVSELLMILIG